MFAALAAIERIEILRGSDTVLYGGGTAGGTINIITRSPLAGDRKADIGGGFGSYGTRDLRGGVTLAGKRFGLTLNAVCRGTILIPCPGRRIC